MNQPTDIHAQQLAYWNGPGAEMWVVRQAQMDASLAPVSRAILAHAAPQPGEVVIDIGCGTGDTVLALADAVGSAGHVTGLDVSAPMLGLARTRAEGRANVTLVLSDAAAHAFVPGAADLLFSRFGVMFFGDPVAAFANMRKGLKPGGRVAFACWRPAADNPWVRVPQQAMAPLLPPQPKQDPGLPGQFAFGDAALVQRILISAGFAGVGFTEFTFAMPLGRSLEDAVERASGFGANGRALADQPDTVKQAARDAIRAALTPHADAKGFVALPGSIWLVGARAS
jgi:SAM-dependent methyltransferase